MSAFGPTEIAEAFVDAINKHDIESLCKLMSKDSVFVDALGTRVEGVRSLRLAWQEFFAACPAYVMVLDAVSATGDTVGLFGSAAGMHGQPRDGQGFGDDAIPAAWRATIRGGLIAEWRVYCNVTSIVDTVEICDATPRDPTPGSLSHVEIYVSNLGQSVSFWSWFLEQLGYTSHQTWPMGRSWKLGDTYLVLVQAEPGHLDPPYHRKRPGLNHLAFHARSRDQVDRLTESLRGRGVTILYEDRHPHAGGPDSYAVFFEDPDRIKVELVAP